MIYTIRNCQKQELSLLQEFIHKYWKADHCLSNTEILMRFQHWDNQYESYNFLIAINKETKEIEGIMGYIPTSQYDESLSINGDYWGAIWKIREDVNNEEIKLLGLFLWEELTNKEGFMSFAAIGISGVAKQFYKLARLKLGTLNQYYILKDGLSSYKVAKNVASERPYSALDSDGSKIKQVSLQDSELSFIEPKYKPLKSIEYLIRRYLNHPVYNYSFWTLSNVLGVQALIVIRKIESNGASILRIVDCLGNLESLPNLYNDFQSLLELENAEYIDCLNSGIPENIFLQMGFTSLDFDNENVIIPTYFEPFLQKNVKIEFAYKAPYDNYVIFKGDSDQDRPNIIK
ncbi:hypothetical protein [Dysgonomonas sp. HGC4]|uniref:hypothetical protein n=1 Tax=Dysgonomonas sp. HGC4 TaxID=1658009 RepID=UPI000680F5EF|nr:hypothetical protein [Dysgonomonas sp. HGC4]MBD8349075.1 hypothetical protein [Dysgonomonas sp. HGC4]